MYRKAWPRVVVYLPHYFQYLLMINFIKRSRTAEIGIQLSSGKTAGRILFADDFVGISDSEESLHKLIDVVYSHCSKLRL